MKIYKPSALAIALSACLAASCVTNKIHLQALSQNASLEKQVIRSNEEIREIKDQKQVLEDEVKAKNTEITRLREDLAKDLKTIGECTDRVKVLNDELLQLKISLEGKNNESASLVAAYEQRLGLLNHELALAKKRKHWRKRHNVKMMAKR